MNRILKMLLTDFDNVKTLSDLKEHVKFYNFDPFFDGITIDAWLKGDENDSRFKVEVKCFEQKYNSCIIDLTLKYQVINGELFNYFKEADLAVL